MRIGGVEMTTLSKRSTIYLKPELHKALRIKSIETSRSMSELINEAVASKLAEDAEDLAVFEERADEQLVSYEDMVKELKFLDQEFRFRFRT